MAIILVPQPGSAPSSLTDWENSVETLKQYNLGVNNPVDYNFDGNTIKKGVLITIGGSNYYCNADTAITGTTSDYVKITSAGVATYVSSLSGVSWNDTYNFYADSSGNAYIFNEAKAGLANTAIGAFAEHGYFTEIDVAGSMVLRGDMIITGTLNGPTNAAFNINAKPNESSEYLNFQINSVTKAALTYDGNFLIGTTTDSGYKLDVAGSASFSGGVTTDNVAIKHKEFSGVLDSVGNSVFAHGLSQGKILGVFIIVNLEVPINMDSLYVLSTNISISTGADLAHLPYSCLVTYKA